MGPEGRKREVIDRAPFLSSTSDSTMRGILVSMLLGWALPLVLLFFPGVRAGVRARVSVNGTTTGPGFSRAEGKRDFPINDDNNK